MDRSATVETNSISELQRKMLTWNSVKAQE